MPDWIANIGLSAAGLPWGAAFALLVLLWITREVVPAINKWRGTNLEERKYGDSEAKEAREALVEELRRQVMTLVKDVQELTKQHISSAAAHVKCQLEQAELRGEMNVMKEKLARLEKHDQNNIDNTRKLAKLVQDETGKSPPIT